MAAKGIFIVNPGGAVLSVEEGVARRKLAIPRRQGRAKFREATTAEIAAWYEQQGLPVPAEFSPQSNSMKAATDADESNHQSGAGLSDIPAERNRRSARKGRNTSGQ